MSERIEILKQIEGLRDYIAKLSVHLSNPALMPSEIGEIMELIEDVKLDIRELEKEYHELTDQIWSKGSGNGENKQAEKPDVP